MELVTTVASSMDPLLASGDGLVGQLSQETKRVAGHRMEENKDNKGPAE